MITDEEFEEYSDILYDRYAVYKSEVLDALWLLADEDETGYRVLVKELATKIENKLKESEK